MTPGAQRIAPEIAHLATPIFQVRPHPENVRQGDRAAIKQSLKDHGQYAPLLVQTSSGYVIKGNNTLAAAIELLWSEIAVDYRDVDDDEARKILSVDNRTSDLAGYDEEGLARQLSEIKMSRNYEGTGWDEQAVDKTLTDIGMRLTTPIPKIGGGRRSESPERRHTGYIPSERPHDFQVVVQPSEHQQFLQDVRRLQKLYNTGGLSATILEAVRRQASGLLG